MNGLFTPTLHPSLYSTHNPDNTLYVPLFSLSLVRVLEGAPSVTTS